MVGTLPLLPASLILASQWLPMFSHPSCGSSNLIKIMPPLGNFVSFRDSWIHPTHKYTETPLHSRGNLILLKENPRESGRLHLRGTIVWGLLSLHLLVQTSWKTSPSDVHKHLSVHALSRTWTQKTGPLPADCLWGKQVALCFRPTPIRTQT